MCSQSWTRDGNLKGHGFVRHQGITDGIVGVALNGVPFYTGTSVFGYDAFFPQAYGGRQNPRRMEVDHCLGNIDSTGYYKYFSFSPCIFETQTAQIKTATMCDEIEECNIDIKDYMTS